MTVLFTVLGTWLFTDLVSPAVDGLVLWKRINPIPFGHTVGKSRGAKHGKQYNDGKPYTSADIPSVAEAASH